MSSNEDQTIHRAHFSSILSNHSDRPPIESSSNYGDDTEDAAKSFDGGATADDFDDAPTGFAPRDGAIPFSRPSTPKLSQHDRLAFVGLGNMGIKMSLNLARHLHAMDQPPLKVWNRSSQRVDAFRKLADAEGIPFEVATDLRQIAASCDIIITSLGSDSAVEAVYAELFSGQESKSDQGDGILPTGTRGRSSIFVDTSTIYPHLAGKLERTCSSKPHRHFISCPVFGPPPMAEKAQLLLAISGSYHAKKHVSHVLVPAIGRKVMDLGSNVERAMAFKLVGNSMVLGILELLAETTTLADQSGVGSEKLYELITEFFPAPSFLSYGRKMIDNNFKGEGGFTLPGGIKDASHIRKLAEECSVPMPIIDVAHQHLVTARVHGGDQLDWSSMVGGERISAGLEPFSSKPRLQKYEG